MNKKHRFNILFIAACLVMAFASCSDWTDTESLDLIEADIEKDNPELYAEYLANLRHYRTTDHKLMYVWFNNTKDAPRSRGEQLNTLPDSVDIVNLINPDELSTWVIDDMKKMRDKGMRFVFTISYLDLEREYEQYLLQHEEESEGEEVDGFLAYAADFANRHLALADKYDYDGISVLFYGMKTTHLTEESKEAYLAREAAFMSKITGWVNNNPGKLFLFEGYPQNLTDKSILQRAELIVVRTELVKYASGLSYQVLLCIEEGVPVDKFAITVSARDFIDDNIGYYFNTNNEPVPAIPIAAEWIDTYEAAFNKAGLGIINAQNDYYNGSNSYKNVRDAISIMNSSPKL